jgi:hypothetical protein
MGQKMVCFAALSGTRSRQGAPIEVHEAGRIRPSSGCNGVHFLQWSPLFSRLLGAGVCLRESEVQELRGSHHDCVRKMCRISMFDVAC